jgi:deazaflavin-dependent oxidoreductase (nitroreductase family)
VYRTPLSYVTLENGYALAGSNWGGENHPAWSYNLIEHPDIEVVAGHQTIPVRARLVSDDEKAQLWPRFVAMWPAYDTYKTRASHRNIRVFVLERR